MGVGKFTRPVHLEESMELEGFSSGQPFVDGWLATRAAKAKQRGSAVVYVSHRAGADVRAEPPAGFYTLSSASIDRDLIGGGWLKRNAPSEVPVILLGVLGVDSRYQGSGLGRMLLRDASARAVAIAGDLGAKALVVDPVDEEAAAFYARNGFEWVPGLDRTFVQLKTAGDMPGIPRRQSSKEGPSPITPESRANASCLSQNRNCGIHGRSRRA